MNRADSIEHEVGIEYARRLDASDPMTSFRDRFHIPVRSDGSEMKYFCGNSLGLMPRGVDEDVQAELEDWKNLAVGGHLRGRNPWYPYHEQFREPGARLVGALPSEVVFMNTLTVNLHFLLASFYRPSSSRFRILCEAPAFPSDSYALSSQVRWHGYDPKEAIIVVEPRSGEDCVREEDLVAALKEDGDSIATVLLGGVNFFNGQAIDIERITGTAHEAGAVIGFDLAHAAGNLELRLHDWNVDFAAWCSYKYGNAGPGAVAGAFVHHRHGNDPDLPRLAGWWGNDPSTRFQMQFIEEFVPQPGADGWQISNPPIFSMTPLKQSLAIFDEASMTALRERSIRLTGYMEWLIDSIDESPYSLISPRDRQRRGCQLSLRFSNDAQGLQQALEAKGFVCDFRPPDVVRLAPVPLYNTFEDIHQLVDVLNDQVGG